MSVISAVKARAARPGGKAFVGIGILVTVVVTFIVVYPLLTVLSRLFLVDGKLDFSAFAQTMAQSGLGEVFANTGIVVGISGVLAILIAGFLAWMNERTDARLGAIGEFLPIMSLVVPPIASSIGWVFLMSPSVGYFNVWIRGFLHLFGVNLTTGPFDIFSWPGMILPYTAYLIPYAYFQIANALRNLDPALEQAARVNGAGRWKTFRTVTLPSLLPSLASSMVLVLIMGLAMYSIPVIIGTGAQHEVLSVRIVRLLTASYPPQTGVAVVLSTVLLVVVLGASLLQTRLARSARAAKVSGRGRIGERAKLGAWRWPVRAVMLLYILFAAVLPFLAVVFVSLQHFWSPNIVLNTLGFDAYSTIFAPGQLASSGLIRSLILGAVGATIATALAVAMVLLARRSKRFVGRWVAIIASLPGSVSHIVLATGFILAFAAAPFGLGGTSAILLICYVALYIPQTYFSASSAINQLGTEMMDASHTSGAGPVRTFRKILIPLAGRGITGGWILVFALILGDLTASVLLAGTTNTVVGYVLLDLYQNGTYPPLAALATVVSLVSGVVLLIVTRLTRGVGPVGAG